MVRMRAECGSPVLGGRADGSEEALCLVTAHEVSAVVHRPLTFRVQFPAPCTLLALLLGCTPKTPPVLFTTPQRVIEVLPVDDGADPEPGECRTEHHVDAGDAAPCTGVLLPGVGPGSFATYLEHQRRDRSLTDAYGVCVDGREGDRVWADQEYGVCRVELLEERRQGAGLRLAVPAAFVAGVGVGGGIVYGLARAFFAGLER